MSTHSVTPQKMEEKGMSRSMKIAVLVLVLLLPIFVLAYQRTKEKASQDNTASQAMLDWNAGGFKQMLWPLNLNASKTSMLGEKRSMNLGYGYGCRTFGAKSSTSYKKYCKGLKLRLSLGTKTYIREARGFHGGQDIPGKVGDPIFASANGIVVVAKKRYGAHAIADQYEKLNEKQLRNMPVRIKEIYRKKGYKALSKNDQLYLKNGRWWGASCGNTLIIKHLGGLVKTLLCGSHKLLVREGQKVKRGEVIALIGSTGNSTGPHMHLATWVQTTQNGVKRYLKISPRFLMPLNIPEVDRDTSYLSESDAVARMFLMRNGQYPQRYVKPPALLYPLARMVGSEAPYAYKKGYAQHGKKQYWMLRELIAEVGMNRYLLYNKLGKSQLTPKDILIGRGLRKYGTQHSQPGMQFSTHRKPHLKDIALAGKKIWGFLPYMSAKYGYVTRYHFTGVQNQLAKSHNGSSDKEVQKRLCKGGLYLAPMIHNERFVPYVTFYGEKRMLTAKGLKQLVPAGDGCMSAPRNGFKNPAESVRFYGIHEKMYLVDIYKSTQAVNTLSK